MPLFDRFRNQNIPAPKPQKSEAEIAAERAAEAAKNQPSPEILAMREQLAGVIGGLSTLQQTVGQAFSQPQRQQEPAQPVKQVTAADVAKAAAALRDAEDEDFEALNQAYAETLEAFTSQKVSAAAQPFQQQLAGGAKTLESHTKHLLMMRGVIPLYGPAGDPSITKQVDEMLDSITDPAVRGDERVIERAYQAVMGRPENFQKFVEREVSKRLGTDEKQGFPGIGGRSAETAMSRDTPNAKGKIPSPTDLGGQDAATALAHLGQGGKSEDEFAKALGYQSWSHYMEVCGPYINQTYAQ